MRKVTVIGAGNVGATIAYTLAVEGFVNEVLTSASMRAPIFPSAWIAKGDRCRCRTSVRAAAMRRILRCDWGFWTFCLRSACRCCLTRRFPVWMMSALPSC